MKRVGNTELSTINNAGHLVPRDQPEAAQSMAIDFIKYALQPGEGYHLNTIN